MTKKFKRVIDASLLRQAYAVYGDDRYLQALKKVPGAEAKRDALFFETH